MSGAVLVLSGPSGAGKSTIISNSLDRIGDFYFSISTTTREPREGERDGVEYYFVSKEEFEEGIKRGDFLEYAIVHGNYYGTSIAPVRDALSSGKLVIFDIDVQGHRLVRDSIGDLVTSIFITPPTLKELKRRLYSRSSDRDDVIEKRLENAKSEIRAVGEFDFVIINDEIDIAVEQFITIAKASRLKFSKEDLEQLISRWENGI
jgi:guanylate kinase